MKSILEAIKKFPNEFMATASARSITTPSEINKRNHIALQQAIFKKDWDSVKEIITEPTYYNALNGVVYCLGHYSSIGMVDQHTICELMDNNNLA